MTYSASGWESSGRMVRTRRGLVNRLMAGIAVGRGVRVVVVYMTLRACNIHMRTSQWKARVVMVERRWDPTRRGVANVALLWEPCGSMVRIGGSSIVLDVACHASC